MNNPIYQSYINQPNRFFAPSPRLNIKTRGSSRESKRKDNHSPMTITKFSNKTAMPHLMATSMYSTYTDSWLRETIRNFSCKRRKNEEWNNNFEQGNGRDIISLESKIKEPKIKMFRRRGSEVSSIDSIGEFYTYLKPRSIELSPAPTHKANSRSASPSKNKKGSLTQNIDNMLKLEINEKRLFDERSERYTPDQKGRRRSIHYGCTSPGIFQSSIINNYLQEFQ
ncbi:unnamed protein product [Blepharisma stoltei]|uniref:Uncharacterized protein n=1 Tax=Blepharisma stoltei TaxID=1481888 RepID=A0AAU9J011_9CILI|nr:unnamed protein product [Blepharisma stoltei]